MKKYVPLSLLVFILAFSLCPAEVVVTVSPPTAVEQGAQWHILSEPDVWYDPNVAVSLPPGMHTIEFADLSDWAEPPAIQIVDAIDTMQELGVIYTPLTRLPVGQIPNQTAWHGQLLEFMVCLEAPNEQAIAEASLLAETQPAPAGEFDFFAAHEPGYWVLRYLPAAEDSGEFMVLLEAQAAPGLRKFCQLVRITPMEDLADETVIFKTGQHTKMISGVSSIRTNEDIPAAAAQPFNYQTNVRPRAIRIEGDRIDISRYNDGNRLYQQLCAVRDPMGNLLNADIGSVEIIADVLVIKTRLWLPGTQVTIKAVELYFEDEDPGEPACVVTTPVELTERPALGAGATQGANGLAGLNAGSILVDVMEFHSASPASGAVWPRFILAGGQGQPGGHGRNGANGPNLDYKDSFQVRVETWAGTDKAWTHLENPSPYKITSILYHDHSDGWDFDWDSFAGWHGTTTLPNGENAVRGGLPGAGGNAGMLRSTVPLDSLYSVSAGLKGQRVPTYLGGQRGTPLYYVQLIYDLYGAWMGSGSCETNWGFYGYAQPGANATPPDDSGIPEGQAGGFEAIATSMEQFSPENFNQNLNIIRQFYLANQIEVCTQKIDKYIQLIDLYRQRSDWASLPFVRRCRIESIYAELRSMQNRIENGLDYYGNPAGWAPMLSFEVNRTIFDNEIDRAIRMLYLSYWLREEAGTAQARVGALTDTIEAMKDEIVLLKGRYDEAVETLPDLETESLFLQQSTEVVRGKLKHREDELRLQAQNALREPWWKTGLKLAASMCSMIPVYQPALGAVGMGMNLGANFDSGDPWAAIAGAADITTTLGACGLKYSAQMQKAGLADLDADVADDEDRNAAYLAMLSEGGSAVTSAFSEISGIVAAREAPKSRIDAELARLAAEDETFQVLADEIKELLDQKAALARKIALAVQDISTIPNQIATNVQSINCFMREKGSGEAVLGDEALEYLTAMDNRANDRLIKYHYYLAKGYEYRLLRPYTNPLDLTPMFERFREIALVNAAEGHVLSPDQFESFKAIYEDILAGIAETIFDEYNRNARPEYTVTARFNLLPEELEKINAGGPLWLNPMEIGLFNGLYEENLRIVDLSVHAIVADADGTPLGDTAYVDLRIEHPGESKLKSNGTVYLFRYSQGGDSRPIEWGGRYHLAEDLIEAIHPSAASESLLRSLLKGDAASDMMLYSRPSAWGDLKLSKSSVNTVRTPGGVVTRDDIVIRDLRLELTYDFVRKNTTLAEVQVGVLQGRFENGQWVNALSEFEPTVRVNRIDENDRQDGRGGFLRIYRKSPDDTVRLSAPAVYGAWRFLDWVDCEGRPLAASAADLSLPLTADCKVYCRYVPRNGVCGDFNADGGVDMADLGWFARLYGSDCYSVELDSASGPGRIDLDDLAVFSDQWLLGVGDMPLAAGAAAAPPVAGSMPAGRRAIEVVTVEFSGVGD